MKILQRAARWIGVLAAGILLAGCASEVYVREQPAYVPPPPPPAPAVVYAPAPPPPAPIVVEAGPPPAIVIYRTDDFYAPLSAYGRWSDVPGVGHCWVPTQVQADWRPYSDGHWERTDAGWYWVSDEPWGWATCHYGRWDWNPDYGWYWAPDVVWGPAWVSWRNGGGYVGWAPLPPAAVYRPEEGVRFDANSIPARSYCFVPEAHFTEPVRHTTVIVNNVTIVNKTVNITKITVVNKTIINEGPPRERIEQATGRAVPVVKAADVRQRVETHVAVKPKPAEPGERERAVTNEPHPKPVTPRQEEKAVITREEHPEQKPVVRQEKPIEKPVLQHAEQPVLKQPGQPLEKPVVTREERPALKTEPVARPEQTQVKPKSTPQVEQRDEKRIDQQAEHPVTRAEHPATGQTENLKPRNEPHPQVEGQRTPETKEQPQKPKPKAPVRKPGETNAPAEHREPQQREPGQ